MLSAHGQSPLTPPVTIGIPTYNRADGYLRTCLEAALAQDYAQLEIIVSDNCSSDGTQELMSGYTDPRLRYIRHKENIGANPNFNYCLDQAKGQYFLLLHDDDLIDPDFVSSCISAIPPGTTAGIVRTGTRIIDTHGSVVYEAENLTATDKFTSFWGDWCTGQTSYYLCSTLFNTESVRRLGGFGSPTNLLLDLVAAVRITGSESWVDVRQVKASFRKHAGEMTVAAGIEDWCIDSHHFLSCFEEIAGDDEQFMALAKEAVCRMAYKRCESVHPLRARLRAYADVDAHFQSVIPWKQHLLSRQVSRVAGKSRALFSAAS
ncbi:MAG: glycosyltransferase family 2 protein [Granulosicoccus sp.]